MKLFEKEIMAALLSRYDEVALKFKSEWPEESLSEANERHVIEKSIMALASPTPGEEVIDIGTGRRARYALACALMGADVLAIDISPLTVEAARNHTQSQYPGASLNIICANALRIPMSTETVDLVICSETLEYWPPESVSKILEEIARILKPGGRCVIDFPELKNPMSTIIAQEEIESGVSFFLFDDEVQEELIFQSGLKVVKKYKAGIEIQYLANKAI